jgi:hypothetical protein
MPGGIHPPLEVILSWPKPNVVDPVRRDWMLPILTIVIFFVTLAVVTARLWARLVIHHNAGIDDALIVLAMVCSLHIRARYSDLP